MLLVCADTYSVLVPLDELPALQSLSSTKSVWSKGKLLAIKKSKSVKDAQGEEKEGNPEVWKKGRKDVAAHQIKRTSTIRR